MSTSLGGAINYNVNFSQEGQHKKNHFRGERPTFERSLFKTIMLISLWGSMNHNVNFLQEGQQSMMPTFLKKDNKIVVSQKRRWKNPFTKILNTFSKKITPKGKIVISQKKQENSSKSCNMKMKWAYNVTEFVKHCKTVLVRKMRRFSKSLCKMHDNKILLLIT
jgi:hypothetical protein